MLKKILLSAIVFMLFVITGCQAPSLELKMSSLEPDITPNITMPAETFDEDKDKVNIEPLVSYLGSALISKMPVLQVTPAPIPKERKTDLIKPVINIYKSDRILQVVDEGEICAQMRIAIGFEPVGEKEKEGDGKTPEGEYYICYANPNSKFYLSFGLSYPNNKDAQNGLDKELISSDTYNSIKTAIDDRERPNWYTRLGGEIMIHGHGSKSDWTTGCIALDDEDIDYLWENCQIGTNVNIYP